MTSPVMSAPAVSPSPCLDAPRTAPPTIGAPGVPLARAADADEYGPTLVIGLDTPEGGPRDRITLRADGEIDLLTVAPLRAALDQALAAGHGVVIDLRGVSFVDCAGIGLLVDARLRARARGIALRILPSRTVARVAGLLDLTAALALEPVQGRAA